MTHPGEISLACHGVLFLDELPELSQRVLEALRQPLENARGVFSRAAGTATHVNDQCPARGTELDRGQDLPTPGTSSR